MRLLSFWRGRVRGFIVRNGGEVDSSLLSKTGLIGEERGEDCIIYAVH